MSATLRDRADHAARYGANLVVPATEIKQLLHELDVMTSVARAALDTNLAAETALDRVRKLHTPAQVFALSEECTDPETHSWISASHGGDEVCANEPTGQLFCTACAPEDTFDCTDFPYPCPTAEAAALAEGGEQR